MKQNAGNFIKQRKRKLRAGASIIDDSSSQNTQQIIEMDNEEEEYGDESNISADHGNGA
jgi:hypothetical protein